MKVAFHTLGCKLNYAETSQLQAQFEAAGYTVVPFGAASDVLVVNTCTVTENADRECRQVIRRALRTSPEAYVAVTGCYAQLQPERIAAIEGVSAVFGARDKFSITEKLAASGAARPDAPQLYVGELDGDLPFNPALSADSDGRTRAFLKLQDGCNYKCSFCTIPLARGRSRAMNFDEIPQRIAELERAGYREVVLTGVNLGDYVGEQRQRFVDVVRSIEELRPQLRVRISSIEPNLLTLDILDIIRDSNVFVPHFHIPLQSGSPEILRLMRRRYTANNYRALIEAIHERMPDCAVGVDVIVGFPGETDAHFRETMDFLHSLPVTYLHVFTYSERPNTPAAELAGRVPVERRRARTRELRNLSHKKKLDFYRSQLGGRRPVLPEGGADENGMLRGWTDNYVRVQFAAPSRPVLAACIPVDLTELRGDEVFGRVAEAELPAPTSRAAYIPIPV